MKMTRLLKLNVFVTLTSLYVTGVAVWILGRWFLVPNDFGDEPTPLRFFWLQMHSIISLWFLALLGYLFSSHIQPAWKRKKKIKSGLLVTGILVLLSLSVPFLFYLSSEVVKEQVAWLHTYLGLLVIIPFGLHYFTPVEPTARRARSKGRGRSK